MQATAQNQWKYGCPNRQTITNTLPTTSEPGKVPQTRLSAESPRQSPMTKYCPGGILVVGMFSAFSVHRPLRRGNQGSRSGFPFISTVLPCDEIVSPGRPMTRLTRSLSWVPTSCGGRLKTTMSPRWIV